MSAENLDLEENEVVVFDYKMRDLSVDLSKSAKGFLEGEKEDHNGFHIDRLVAGLSGIQKNRDRDVGLLVEEKVLNRLKLVHESAYKKAYDLGYSDGFEKAYQDNKVAIEEKMEHWTLLLQSLETIKQDLLCQGERTIVKLLFLMAQKLVLKELSWDSQILLSLIREALTVIQESDDIVLKVNQKDKDFLGEFQKMSAHKMEELERVRVEVSDQIESGGCLLETNYGVVDATMETRLKHLWKILEERYPSLLGQNVSLESLGKSDFSDGSQGEES